MQLELNKLKFGLLGRKDIRTFQFELIIDGKKIASVREDGNGCNTGKISYMYSIQLLPNKSIHIENVDTTKRNGPLGIVLGYYPYTICKQIQFENQ